MAKIVFLGAGSTVFARNLLSDILSYDELAASEIVLHDIDPERLETSELVARKVAQALGAPATIESSLDRRASLAGADYAINMIQVGGYEPCTVTDRQSATPPASGGSCVAFGPSRCSSRCARTWKSCARTSGCSTTRIRWR